MIQRNFGNGAAAESSQRRVISNRTNIIMACLNKPKKEDEKPIYASSILMECIVTDSI
jgi:hypothetical protein